MSTCETVTRTIIKALRESKIPWRGNCCPCNVLNNEKYEGINVLLLNLAADRHGWTSPYWGTRNQWISQGCVFLPRPQHVKIGAWSQKILLYKPSISSMIELKSLTVFNLEQTKNGFSTLRSQHVIPDFDKADKIIESTKAKINFKLGTTAEYNYGSDEIEFPLKEQFALGPGGLPAYYHSLFHEITHWCESRLAFDTSTIENELRAEICADYICAELGINSFDKRMNHAKNVDKWIEMMQQDPTLIFKITAEASKASNFICNLTKTVLNFVS